MKETVEIDVSEETGHACKLPIILYLDYHVDDGMVFLPIYGWSFLDGKEKSRLKILSKAIDDAISFGRLDSYLWKREDEMTAIMALQAEGDREP